MNSTTIPVTHSPEEIHAQGMELINELQAVLCAAEAHGASVMATSAAALCLHVDVILFVFDHGYLRTKDFNQFVTLSCEELRAALLSAGPDLKGGHGGN
jgi:hypothetical protein